MGTPEKAIATFGLSMMHHITIELILHDSKIAPFQGLEKKEWKIITIVR